MNLPYNDIILGGFYDEDDHTDLFKPQDDEQEEDEQSAKIRHEKELFWLKMKSVSTSNDEVALTKCNPLNYLNVSEKRRNGIG